MKLKKRSTGSALPILIIAAFLIAMSSHSLHAAPADNADAQEVKVRLVLAEQRQEAVEDDELADITPLLRQNLRYNTYRLLQAETVTPRSGLALTLRHDLTLTFLQVSGNALSVRISRDDQPLVNTRLTLRPNHPVVLGGFPHTDQSVLIIILGEGAQE